MASLTGILFEVSGSMRRSIGEGTNEELGPWALSIFEVIDNLIKHSISPDHHIFALGFGANCGEELFDIIRTLKQIPNQETAVEGPATPDHINQIFDILEGAGARTIRQWVPLEVVSEALSDNLAVGFLKKFKSDQSFLKEFVEQALPPACRDWPELGLGHYLMLGGIAGIATIPLLATVGLGLALKFGPRAGKKVYSSVMTRYYKGATVDDVTEVVEKVKGHLLINVNEESIFRVQDASDVVRGCLQKLFRTSSRELLQMIEPYIYGRTPFYQSIEKAIKLFQASRFSSHKKLLYIFSSGEPSDGESTDAARIDRLVCELATAGVTVVSCFVSDSAQIEPKRLFSKMREDWNPGAKLMFSLSSKLRTQSIPRKFFVKRGWFIEFTDNETHLFLQFNHPDNWQEISEVAGNVICCQDAFSDFLASLDLDLYINQEVMGYEAKRRQKGPTCYANAAATVLYLSMRRILGREGGYPNFYKLREEIIERFHWSTGFHTLQVLQEMCKKYRLHCKQVDLEGAMKAVISSRPVVASVRLTEHEWKRFANFFRRNPKGVLTKKEIDITARLPNAPTIGLAVVLTSFDSKCLHLLNSWGETWGDMGYFRVQNPDVLALEFIDVYWTKEDLTEVEKIRYEKRGSDIAKILKSSCVGISDKIEVATIDLDENTILDIKATMKKFDHFGQG